MLKATSKQTPEFSDNFKYVIDNQGKKRNYNDPDVAHIYAFDINEYILKMVENTFKKMDWNCRIPGRSTRKTIRNAKKHCSGRECLSFTSSAGHIFTDILEKRSDKELSIYYYLKADNPCQIGAWPDVWKVFGEKLGVDNAIYMAMPDITNNFMGQGNSFGWDLSAAVILGDIFIEAKHALRCLTDDDPSALKVFEKETEIVMDNFSRGPRQIKKSLNSWAHAISKIPLKHNINDIPRIFVFGAGEVEFLCDPVVDFFISQGIIPKVVDVSGFLYLLTVTKYTKYALKRGKVPLRDQTNLLSFLLSVYTSGTNYKEAFEAMRSGILSKDIDSTRMQFMKIAWNSGLFNTCDPASFKKIAFEGNDYASFNTFSETPQVVGNFVAASRSGEFNGLMHLLTFNCQPSVNAQAIIRPLATHCDVPYASMDMDGNVVSANNLKILETLAVQTKRHHREHSALTC